MTDCAVSGGMLAEDIDGYAYPSPMAHCACVVGQGVVKASQAIGAELLPILLSIKALITDPAILTESIDHLDLPSRTLRCLDIFHETGEAVQNGFHQYSRILSFLYHATVMVGLSPVVGFSVLGLLHAVGIAVVWVCISLVCRMLGTVVKLLVTLILSLLAIITG
ncbi:MAG: hypothetical protein Q9192_001591 [Flavoplaca navasiana]